MYDPYPLENSTLPLVSHRYRSPRPVVPRYLGEPVPLQEPEDPDPAGVDTNSNPVRLAFQRGVSVRFHCVENRSQDGKQNSVAPDVWMEDSSRLGGLSAERR